MTRERDEFIAAITKEGVPVDVARLVLRHAASLTRIAEAACSSEAADRDRVRCPGHNGTSCLCRQYGYDGVVPRIYVREQRIEARVTALLAPYHVTPVFQGDPRGAVVKLRVPSGRTDDWGQTGLCVPVR